MSKIPEVYESNGHIEIKHVDYGLLTKKVEEVQAHEAPNQDRNIYETIVKKFAVHAPHVKTPTGQIPIINTMDPAPIHAFASKTIAVPKVDIFHIVQKMILYIIASFPIILILISLGMFFADKPGAQINDYPQWMSIKIERFVEHEIIPITKKN